LRADAGADSGLLLAVLLGERGLLTTGQRDALSRSGLFHLVALSGLHVGLLLVLLALVAHLAGIPPAWRDVSGLCLLIVYGLLASASPSLVRALFMAGIFLAACLLARPQGALYAWSVSLAALLIWNPAWILDTGFQLTFAATLGIIGLWNAMPAHFAMEGAAGWITRLLWVGFSAQLSTLPILALDFHRISPLGWLATPLASVPIMAIQVLGLPYILGLAFVPGVHQVLGKGLALSARIFMVLPTRLGAAGWGSIFIPRPALVWTVLFVAGLCALAVPGRRRRAGWVLATVAVVGAWTLPWLRPRTVIEPFLAAAGRRRVDGIVLTHWDSDHSGATPDLLRDLDVGFVAYPATDPPSRGLPGFIARTARSEGVSLIPLRTSDTLRVGAFRAEILHPDPDRPESSENDRCLVARIREGGRTFLVTGDIEADAERHILEGGLIRPVFGEIVPHHGSATSSTPPWVQASSPRAAFFSVGRANRFGHPAQSVLQRYIRIGSSIFRTDRDGALLVAWPSRRPMVYRMRNGSWLPPPRR
jgi:competence protein ComEC